jgi:uncharacterized protein
MLESWSTADDLVNNPYFQRDEVPFNLLYRICELDGATCLKSKDGTLIFAQSPGHNGWLWMSKEITDSERDERLRELAEVLESHELPGITGLPNTVERFANLYANAKQLHYDTHMGMESYCCPKVLKPQHVGGTMEKALGNRTGIVASFLAGFSESAYGVTVTPESQLSAAEGLIRQGNLYFWMIEGQPVSMANIAHRSPRHGRINAVYTPSAARKQGYASALVAEVCELLHRESLQPMLYADLTNPNSNKVYQQIGFVSSGKVADIKFEKRMSTVGD